MEHKKEEQTYYRWAILLVAGVVAVVLLVLGFRWVQAQYRDCESDISGVEYWMSELRGRAEVVIANRGKPTGPEWEGQNLYSFQYDYLKACLMSEYNMLLEIKSTLSRWEQRVHENMSVPYPAPRNREEFDAWLQKEIDITCDELDAYFDRACSEVQRTEAEIAAWRRSHRWIPKFPRVFFEVRMMREQAQALHDAVEIR